MATVMNTQVDALEREILDIGELVELAISRSISSLIRRDVDLAKTVIRDDERIDQAEVAFETHCLEILENDHPSGQDLRFIIATLKINDSLERIADHAENVAETVARIGKWERFLQVKGIEDMATKAQAMVRDSLSALVQRDTKLAESVIAQDDEVDTAQEQIRERIEFELDRIPENASPLLSLESVTRQFERIADIACNIAEEVIYLVDGKIVRHR